MIKKLFARLKNIFDAYKMWLFFLALFGTNAMQAGVQEYVRSEPVQKVVTTTKKVKPVAKKPVQKTIIIHKFDAELAKKLIKLELDKHKNGSQH